MTAQAPRPAPPSTGTRIARQIWTQVADAWTLTGRALRAAPGRAAARLTAPLRQLGAADPARALAIARMLRRLRLGGAFARRAEALFTARARGWAAAAPLFRRPAAPGTALGLLRGRQAPAADLALPELGRPTDVPADVGLRVVIYTTALGPEPDPAPLFHLPAGVRAVCLTDRAGLAVPGWTAAALPATAPDTAEAAALWCRARPEAALAEAAPEAEASLWIAPDRWFTGNLDTLLARWLLPQDFALWRHEGGIDWQDLAEHALLTGAEPEAVLAQASACAARGLPRGGGAWDTGVIWRRHARPEVAAFGAAWWAAAQALPGPEAIALYAALNDPAAPPPARPRLMPAALGAASDTAFAARRPPAPVPRGRAAPAVPRPRAVAGRPLPLAMVYSEAHAASASTFLRGRQLADLVAAHDPDGVDMLYTSDTAALRDRVVVLTKNAIEVHSASALADLAARNIAVVGSWDDMLPDPAKVAAMTGSMTLSHRQTTDFARAFPDRPAFHVTHHVNTQVPASTPPMDRLRAGYFGLLRNTHRPESLAGIVDLVGIATASVEMNWIDALPAYNCHWIVRRRGKLHDGWKPFLKGFLAARCKAVVVTGRGDDDALAYLGDDYPFYVHGLEAAGLEYDMMQIAAAFGGPDWRRAQDIMAQVAARSSDAVVVAEFRAMVRSLMA